MKRTCGRTRVLVAGVAFVAACGGGDAPAVERTVIGDTTVVRNHGDGIWGDSVRLEEELSIGELEGADELQFGFVSELAVDRDGGIYVFDGQAPALRYYDSAGRYVRTLGGEGEGPGEYHDVALGIVVRGGDGRVVMRDPRNARLNVYESDGRPSESWRVDSGLFTSDATTVDHRDHLYLKIMTGRTEPNRPWPIALQHLDDQGRIVDTIAPPTLPGEPETTGGLFAPSKVWAMSPLGGIVAGVTDRYSIEYFRPDGTVLRIRRDVEPAKLGAEEKAEREALNEWSGHSAAMKDAVVPTPDVKPFFRLIQVGEVGRLWVLRFVPAQKGDPVPVPAIPDFQDRPVITWTEPTVYDVFEPDGTFLGSVRVPERVNLMIFRGDLAWGVRRGELDEPYVVRYRLVHG